MPHYMLIRNTHYSIYALIFLFLALNPVFAQDIAPEPATGFTAKSAVSGRDFMIVTAHPLATKAGYDILKRGGTAADAGIAAQLVLGLVEPQSSGLGGGGFALYFDKARGRLISLDGRETAPATVGKHLFRGSNGQPMKFFDAAVGGRAIGVPGLPALLGKLHEWHGKLPWRDLFSPAIAHAETGFQVTPRLAQMVAKDRSRLRRYTDTRLYFYPDGVTPVQAGYLLRNPDYAETLRGLAINGAQSFYNGPNAQSMIEEIRNLPDAPSAMTMEDLEGYHVKERQPVCGPYRGYRVCSMNEPSSGGLTLLNALGILQHFDLRALGKENVKSWHLIGEASRLAFADRNFYMADPDVVNTPGVRLIDPAYLKARAALISNKPIQQAMPGKPPGWGGALPAPDTASKPPGTTHISIVDQYGNALSMTTSIENAFGSRVMANGFLLNNQLTDFSFEAEKNGVSVANAVAGGKRPRSSMSPVIVFDPQGEPVLVIGSAGGSAIIGYVLQRIISIIDWDMDIQSALDTPHILHRGSAFEMEEGQTGLKETLEKAGHPVEVKDLNSGLTAIHRIGALYFGAADPRREGMAMGE